MWTAPAPWTRLRPTLTPQHDPAAGAAEQQRAEKSGSPPGSPSNSPPPGALTDPYRLAREASFLASERSRRVKPS
jgi:hypothetical protein